LTSCWQRERHKSELLERTRGLELAIAKLENGVTALNFDQIKEIYGCRGES
jgi:hypothetical protein